MVDIIALINKINIVHDSDELQKNIQEIFDLSKRKTVRIGFLNAHGFNLAFKDTEFYNDIFSCDYIFRDGAGMKILYFFLGRDAGLNLNGTDLIPKFLDMFKNHTIALFGTKPPYLQTASKKIQDMGLAPTHIIDGFREDSEYTNALQNQSADIVLLGMGMPKQERVAKKLSQNISKPALIICGGAILDFIGDKVNRAPDIFRQHGVEWIYRLMQEPRRLFVRYVIGNPVFLYRAFRLSFQRSTPNPSGLKILHVVRQYHPAIGGLETYVRSITAHQKSLGYDCTILTLDNIFQGDKNVLPAQEVIDNVKIKRIPFWGRRRFFIPRISPFYFRNFDIVHVHNTDFFYDYVSICAALWGFPAFATTHGGFFHTKDFSFFKTLYFNTVTRITSGFYNAIFATSQNDYNTFKNMNKNLILQPNAVEPLGRDILTGKDFLYIGRLSKNKNIPELLKVFSHLKSSHGVEGILKIIGPSWDVSIEDLIRICENLGIQDHVVFYGALSPKEMVEAAGSCGYFVSASAFEGFGMSMIEAMSIGLIPLVHKNQAFKELIDKSQCGLCIDYLDPHEAAKKISEYMPQVNLNLRQKAQVFSAQYSWPALVEKTDEMYKGFLAK